MKRFLGPVCVGLTNSLLMTMRVMTTPATSLSTSSIRMRTGPTVAEGSADEMKWSLWVNEVLYFLFALGRWSLSMSAFSCPPRVGKAQLADAVQRKKECSENYIEIFVFPWILIGQNTTLKKTRSIWNLLQGEARARAPTGHEASFPTG